MYCVSNSCNLVRLQLEEARIITGLSIFTYTEYLYREIGWESSNYSIISKTVAHTLIYSILFSQQSKVRLIILFEMATILLFHSVDSFIPATVKEWNSLNLSVLNIDTLSKFKKAIRSSILMSIQRHYSYGPRKLNILFNTASLQCILLELWFM